MKALVRIIIIASLLLLPLTGCGNKENVSNETFSVAEGYDTLGGQLWKVGGIFYRNEIIDIHDNPALEDIHDTTHLSFESDGTFSYLNLFPQTGTYTKYEGDGKYDYYLLRIDRILKYDPKKNEFIETKYSPENTTTYIITVLDDQTIEFVKYDPVTGRAMANEDPLIFVKSDEENPYISENKIDISSGSIGTKSPDDNNITSNFNSGASLNSYQGILDEYTSRMEKAVPGLVREYKSESSGISNVNRLAEICNDKVEDLAKICNDGIGKMAALMHSKGDAYDTYESWAGKLQDNYSDLASEIQDAYMDSAMY